MSYIYLASPYTHADPRIRELRYHGAAQCAAWFLKQEIWIYAPIVHCHHLALNYGMPVEYDFWRRYDECMITSAAELCVFKINGWKESRGVTEEIKFARSLGKPVTSVRLHLESYERGAL